MEIVDKYGRKFQTLRVSLTNTCNLSCIYCVHGSESISTSTTEKNLSYTDIISLISRIKAYTNIHTIRITGGEPTLYKDLIPFVNKLTDAEITNIKMTSNGYLLKNLIPSLANAGLKSINISLDAVTPEGFQQISGKNRLEKIIDAIHLALQYKIAIKINAVILRDVNDNQIIPLLQFSKENNIPIRFLELMRMGPLYKSENFDKHFFSEQEILDKISLCYPFTSVTRKNSSTANYWEMKDGYQFGIIANESTPFCHDCNRLRLDSKGYIYGCLSDDTGIPIFDTLDNPEILKERLQIALAQKQDVKFKGSNLSMMAIGG